MLAKLREKRRNVKEEIKENLKNVSEKSREYF